MGLSKAYNISDCRASIDHPESFLLEPLMVKYFMWVLSLLVLAWYCKGAVPFFFFFVCCFYFLKMKWGNSGEEKRGSVWILALSIMSPLQELQKVIVKLSKWYWCKPTHQVLSAQTLPHSALSEVRTSWMPQLEIAQHSLGPAGTWQQ